MASELLPTAVADEAKRLVAKKTTKVADLVRLGRNARDSILRASTTESLQERLPAPEGEVALTEDEKTALVELREVLASMPATPDSVRELNEAEVHAYVAAVEAVKGVAGIAKRLEALLGVLFKNDNTARGEREGTVTDETPRDGKGWAISARKYKAPGVTSVVSLETKAGAVSLDEAALKQLSIDEAKRVEADPTYVPVLTHEDYLACTTQVRVVDETKVLARVAARPEIVEALQRAATVQNASIALNKR